MSLLADNAVTLLGSTSAMSIATGAGGTIYTTPVGKTTYISFAVFRNPSGSAAAATNLTINGFGATITLAALGAGSTGYLIFPQSTATKGTEVAASTAVVLTCGTGAAGVTCNVDIFGWTR